MALSELTPKVKKTSYWGIRNTAARENSDNRKKLSKRRPLKKKKNTTILQIRGKRVEGEVVNATLWGGIGPNKNFGWCDGLHQSKIKGRRLT